MGTSDSRRSAAGHVEPVEARQAEVEHDEIGSGDAGAVEGIGPVGRLDDVEAGVLEHVADEAADVGLVLGHEDQRHRVIIPDAASDGRGCSAAPAPVGDWTPQRGLVGRPAPRRRRCRRRVLIPDGRTALVPRSRRLAVPGGALRHPRPTSLLGSTDPGACGVGGWRLWRRRSTLPGAGGGTGPVADCVVGGWPAGGMACGADGRDGRRSPGRTVASGALAGSEARPGIGRLRGLRIRGARPWPRPLRRSARHRARSRSLEAVRSGAFAPPVSSRSALSPSVRAPVPAVEHRAESLGDVVLVPAAVRRRDATPAGVARSTSVARRRP